ncbi:mannose-1-phosphate guanylyltransferase [Candidatus Roizmanbacteria bacterium]|nr:mannose-1-phosphate guanylyltransferase [Candidatus Roizmanbacteria bacterium]
MKAVIFAGGVGTRLWPLSRQKSPKQFEKIIGEKSTLQHAVERLLPEFKPQDIYISTGIQYVDVVLKQLPMLPRENILEEPEKKDVGPAVAFMMGYLSKKFPHEPAVILWSDHLVRNQSLFKKIIISSGALVKKEKEKIIFIGQKPRFASDNLGWLETAGIYRKEEGITFHKFAECKYKPNKELAEKYFKDKKYCWNLGYFVSTPHFIYSLFKRFAPQVYRLTENILMSLDKKEFKTIFAKYYHEMPEINFDNAILEQLDENFAYVVIGDIGWSDVGAWEALKEALEEKKDDNITKGNVLLEGSQDNLVYNYDGKKLLVGVDLNSLLIVNTDDVLLVAKKTSVSKIKKMVEGFKGTKLEKLT